MMERYSRVWGAAVLALGCLWAGAAAAEIAAHRAIYAMTLAGSKNDSGVIGAQGTMGYQWGQTCDGWTVEQRYKLKLNYSESQDVDIQSNFVTWESLDNLRYRFTQRETRNGRNDEDIHGSAALEGPEKGGAVEFDKPKSQIMKLPSGTLFPSAHTLLLLQRAEAGDNFISRQVFDGAAVEGSVLVSAVIGPKVEADPEAAKISPLLNRPGWRVRLAFFPANQAAEKPDYELGMMLLDNGISRDLTIDYGDYTIKAKLDTIEALPKPNC